jgi:serine/threonine-protein kinase
MTHLPIDPERRRAIDDLFDGALDQPPDERAAWLDAHCGEAELRAEVEALLRAHDSTHPIFDRNALELAGGLASAPRPERIGVYRVLHELGRGGMGVVYLAERGDGQYRRRVAIKLLRNSPDAEDLTRRFVAERQILASLNHPNIAQLLDGGVTDRHVPFLVMEYVDGVAITTYCDRQRLSIEERLGLFHDVCAAVQHAHQNLVIHRDIKPSNILVTADRRVKLLDFGIAKLINPALGPADQPMTRTAWRVMTPEYASPEQVRGDSLTTASDVYALGVLLYELLSGRRPHRITSGSPQEMAEIIVERDPRLPSVAVSRPEPLRPDAAASDAIPDAIAEARGLSVERLERRLRGDLDAIVLMALRKESARRYGSAELMWEDVQRHLEGLPVIADRGTRWYRARKFLGRYRMEAIATAVVTVSLVTAASIAVRQAAVASRERDRAEQALGQSKEVTEFLVRLFRTPAPAGASRDQVTAKDLLATGTARIEELGGQPIVQAQMLDALGRVNEQLGRYGDAERMLRRALDLRRRQFGDNHPDVATSLNNLAVVIRQTGQRAEAMRLHREALAIQERALGPRHPEVALTLTRLGIVTTGDSVAAESLFRAARDIQRSALGAEDPDIVNTNLLLVGVLRGRGANDEAEALLRENLTISQRRLGSQDPSTAASMTRLGSFLYRERKRPAEAETLYTRALAILRRQAPSGLVLMGVLVDLSHLYADRGDYARAEAFAREAMDVQRRVRGPEHPYVSETMTNLAQQVAAQGRYGEADSLLREAASLVERALGPQHRRVASILFVRARVRSAIGRRDEAEVDLRRSLAITEREDGPKDLWAGASAALLADLLSHRGEKVESDSLFTRAASILRSYPPQTEPDMQAAYAALADHYRATKQPSEEEYFRRLAKGR